MATFIFKKIRLYLIIEKRLFMKYIRQLSYIMAISFLGEILSNIIPLPIPASIYGIIILFLLLLFQIIKIDKVEDTARFLMEVMPIMFIPAAVGLLESWNVIKGSIMQYMILIIITTVLVMIITGKIAQLFMGKDEI